MQLFLHTMEKVRIINGSQEWTGTPSEFQAFEPGYPGLPTLTQSPAVTRYCTPDWKYIEAANGSKTPDMFDALPYCANIANYLGARAVLWIHYDLIPQQGGIMMQADGVPLLGNTTADVLRIVATVRIGQEPEAPIVEQLTQGFPIRMCYKDGAEAFIKFILPASPGVFQIDLCFDGKQPVRYQLFDSDFQAIDMGGVTYAVQQVTPLKIDVYEP